VGNTLKPEFGGSCSFFKMASKNSPAADKIGRHQKARRAPPRIRKETPHSERKQPHELELIPLSTFTAYKTISNELSKRGIEFMVVGAIASSIYGRPRFSRDLDIAISVQGKEKELLDLVRSPDKFRVIYPDRSLSRDEPALESPEDINRVNVIKLRDKQNGALIDLLLVRGNSSIYGLTKDSFSRARMFDGRKQKLSVVSPEDLILMKLVSRRPSTADFDDMFTVMVRNYKSLDGDYLANRAHELNVDRLLESYRKVAERQVQ
jgi:hypothetical protein